MKKNQNENYRNGTGVTFANKFIAMVIGYKNNNKMENTAAAAIRERIFTGGAPAN